MLAVGIKELKNRLSEFVREVQRGEVVLITDRGRVVAELRKPGVHLPEGASPAMRALARLVEQGVVRPAIRRNDPSVYDLPPRLKINVDSQKLLDEEREDKR